MKNSPLEWFLNAAEFQVFELKRRDNSSAQKLSLRCNPVRLRVASVFAVEGPQSAGWIGAHVKPRSFVRLSAVCLAGVAWTSPAFATELALIADAHVSVSHASNNFGNIANLYVGNGNTALLAFDLGSLPTGVTAGQISHATLTLFLNRVDAGGVVSVAPVTGAWSEAGITYGTLPALGPGSSSFRASVAGQYVTVDVTSLVQGWVAYPSTNNGIALSSATANVLFDSKENDQTAHPARLDVTITSMGPTGAPGTPGVQGVTGAQGLQGPQGPAGAIGVQGPQGPAGPTGPAGTIAYQGVYSPSVIYAQNAVVSDSYSYSSYVSLVANNLGHALPTSGPNPYWAVLASQGAQGLPGPAGPAGLTGPTGTTGPAGPAAVIGTGATPLGIQYSISGHTLSDSVLYMSPSGSGQSTLRSPAEMTLAPTSCTPSMTIYSYGITGGRFSLVQVTPSTSASSFSVGRTVMSCSTGQAVGTAQTCSVTASAPLPAGTAITITSPVQASSDTGGAIIAFSCQ